MRLDEHEPQKVLNALGLISERVDAELRDAIRTVALYEQSLVDLQPGRESDAERDVRAIYTACGQRVGIEQLHDMLCDAETISVARVGLTENEETEDE